MNRVVLSDMDLVLLNKYRENCSYDQRGEILHRGFNDFTFLGIKKYNFFTIKNANTINMPKLEETYSLEASKAKYVNLPSLIKAHDITLTSATKIDMPVLKNVRDMEMQFFYGDIDFPELENCDSLNFNSAKTVNLPKLNFFQTIYCRNARIIKIPNIYTANSFGKIYVGKAEKIIVPKYFLRSCLRNLKQDCEIIYLDEKKTNNESFKSFFYNK
jgi:hypothetical protein